MKKIIICCDGTWANSDGGEKEVPSNVTRITRAIKSVAKDGTSQIVYYQAGVGGSGSSFEKVVGGGTGAGLLDNVREAYGFLAHNYHPGDTIHLFGFSRGAYTARSVCGLICRLGLLTRLGMDEFYDVYHQIVIGKLNDESYIADLRTKNGGTLLHSDVKVTTIGCWDTVGSLGIPTLPIPLLGNLISGVSAREYAFLDTDLSTKVLNAFHALALDDDRAPFSPTLWHKKSDNTVTNLRQVWFPGVHTNVGGGYADQEIADMTLAWMIEKTSPWIDFDTNGYIRQITKTGPDFAKEWAAGLMGNARTGVMYLCPKKIRTPAEYASLTETYESFHVSVRVRQLTLKIGWKCEALNGWKYVPAEKGWMKNGKLLKEDWLGDVEKELAGENVVKNMLGWAFPDVLR